MSGYIRPTQSRGFTIIEMLVVVGMITLLLALLFPALQGALGASRKTQEMSNLRQLFQGWQMYSSQNEERLLPGYIDEDVQTAWGLSYTSPDGTAISAADAAPYSWRLANFVGNNYSLFLGYLRDATEDVNQDISKIAQEPAFGYNALHLGGWWVLDNGTPRYIYRDATKDGESVDVVAPSMAGIRRSDSQIIFCASVFLPTADLLEDYHNLSPGGHFVQPSIGVSGLQWTPSPSDEYFPEAKVPNVGAPRPRYNHSVATITADGHTEPLSLLDLVDQRRFIDRASSVDWTFASLDSP